MNVEIVGSSIEVDESLVAEPVDEIRSQVADYASGDRRTFDLTVAFPDGTTGDVMRAMCEIPYGETRSYGELAAELETAPVAVGGACGRNPVPVIVPCHRVVGSDGGLRGYSGADGVRTKRRLLDLEASTRGTRPVQSRLSSEW
ncbi:methylated-DNA--[protein]-cysteine S-methyltransferase [Natrarchaeobius chitinivorans]|uniref:Methylated-DNA--[protein]-cysteine S-methyltransferase n=1 Tax=Natrarchaeobius chitinivorans TaxID=1679083 RepID=A0A3N6LRI1_NATCH|nr:methylated-DNA--[protein]-cysteine S-methyltransferase [Natrarchaeobius chitinivorans]RQG92353.1 methylated-DNA--[protein]-cysteine S-methyltransferase [Natrarchaeobius chitinivorans]